MQKNHIIRGLSRTFSKIGAGSSVSKANSRRTEKGGGFTLIEILVVIGIIAVLAAVVLIAINPARQFAQARNSQRASNVNAILNAVGQNTADNKGTFTCAAGVIPSTPTLIKTGSPGYDMRGCIVSDYMSEIPLDPKTGTFISPTSYDTGYEVYQQPGGRITVKVPTTTQELGQSISVTR